MAGEAPAPHDPMRVYWERAIAVMSDQLAPQTPDDRRAWFERYCDIFKTKRPADLDVTNWFASAPGREIPIRIYRPRTQAPRLATMIYLHGGGYVCGSLETHDSVVANLASGAGIQVVAVHYRRSPENPFPAGLEDANFVLNWVAERAERYGVDPDRICIGGDSAGGGLTAALSMYNRDKGGAKLRAQILLYPGPMNTSVPLDSYVRNVSDPFLKKSDLDYQLEIYLPGMLDTKNPHAVPLQAKDFSRLPPAVVHVAEHDPLHDEGKYYHDRLVEAGVPSDFRIARSLHHSFLRAVDIVPEAKAEAAALYRMIRQVLDLDAKA